MAKKRAASQADAAAEFKDEKAILDALNAPISRMPSYVRFYESLTIHRDILEKGTPEESLDAAIKWWKQLPQIIDQRVDRNKKERRTDQFDADQSEAILEHTEEECIRVHEEAVHALMRLAEQRGIDSTYIEISGRYCREFVRMRKPRSKHFIPIGRWPDCIGPELHTMPPDSRSAILLGNAAVHRLAVASNLPLNDPKYSPWIDSLAMLEVMKLNAIHGTSDDTIRRTKKLWKAESQEGSNLQRFRFRLSTLVQLGISFPEEWNTTPAL